MLPARRWHRYLFIVLALGFGILTLQLNSAHSETCSTRSYPGWYPSTYSYRDSFTSLYGETRACFRGETFTHCGYTSGSQYPGNPLSKLKMIVNSWDKGSSCNGSSFAQKENWMGVWRVCDRV